MLPTEPEDLEVLRVLYCIVLICCVDVKILRWCCDLEVLWLELKQILHLKVDCIFLAVWDRGSLPGRYLYGWCHMCCHICHCG